MAGRKKNAAAKADTKAKAVSLRLPLSGIALTDQVFRPCTRLFSQLEASGPYLTSAL